MINEQKIHAHKANQARQAQLIAFEEEQQWADRTYSSPRAYKKNKLTFKQIIQKITTPLNLNQYLP